MSVSIVTGCGGGIGMGARRFRPSGITVEVSANDLRSYSLGLLR